MSKYNNMKSISYSELKEEEIEKAIKEWAQGNIYMEKLLWECRNNRIETTGCHPLEFPYLEIVVNNSHELIRKMLNAAQSIPDSLITVLPDGGNPISGDMTWDKPTITIAFDICQREQINEALNKLYEAIVLNYGNKIQKDGVMTHMLDIYDFFAERESGLAFYMRHSEDDSYEFNVLYKGNGTENEYYENLLNKAGMNLEDEEWSIVSENEEIFNQKMKSIKAVLINEYSLEVPSEIKPNMNLTIMARVMKRQFMEQNDGEQKFKEWLRLLEKKIELWSSGKITYEECFLLERMKEKQKERTIEGKER